MNIFYLLINILVLALPIAILEITLEKDKGWGAGFSKDTWYGRIIGEKNKFLQFLAKMAGVPYFFGYAVFMYFFLVPALLILEYFFLIPDGVFLLATYAGILFVEDFLWFVFNPYFPSLTELLKGPNGNIWWHKRWVRIGENHYLPASYFGGMSVVMALVIYLYLN